MHVYVCTRTDDLPAVSGVVCVADCRARHVVPGWHPRQSPVHRVWYALRCGVHHGRDPDCPTEDPAVSRLDTSAAP